MRKDKDFKSDWRIKCRQYLAAAFGGKCALCGYDKCLAAFDYHHLGDKETSISIALRNGHSWTKIVEEARKCVLVCCRCHREVHAGLADIPEDCNRFNEEYSDIVKLKEREFDFCPICGEEKYIKRDYCSPGCFHGSQRKFEISAEELRNLVSQHPLTKIGIMFGVSDNAVRKRCRVLGVDLKCRKHSHKTRL